ncbi:hypothetical protein GOBAR_AA10430 [Gossypium barbadense]|uniref:N-acetyltransferase domain-containing protein n=1 Tax=Gossypium barbadense TaxID=3634 RepID=A0A2P5Y3P3_GOSBA|nr:hypothetical protein GOBAR_AA10430 [Gossypium barbadense]
METGAAVVELQRNSTNFANIVEEILKLEKKIFPKHESLSRSFDQELRKNNTGLLYMMDLHGEKESRRRQGHAEALLKAAIQKCRTRNIHRISLHVDPLRIPAMGLYKKLGFQVDSLIKCYYSADRDANRMDKLVQFLDPLTSKEVKYEGFDGGDYNWEGVAGFCPPIVLNLMEKLSLTEKEQEEFVIIGEGNFRFWWCRKVSTGGFPKKEEAEDCVVSKGAEITGLPFERKSCYFFPSTPGTTLLHYHAHVVGLSLVGNVFRRANQYMKASLNRTG